MQPKPTLWDPANRVLSHYIFPYMTLPPCMPNLLHHGGFLENIALQMRGIIPWPVSWKVPIIV